MDGCAVWAPFWEEKTAVDGCAVCSLFWAVVVVCAMLAAGPG
jgi:hypothetical protein